MDALQDTKRQEWGIENVAAGDVSSSLSSAIFFLLCLIPVFSTILFGGVDNVTWIFISVFWAAICLLWLFEAWRAKGLIFNPSVLQLPVIGLLIVGLVQLLPLGPALPVDLISVPYSHTISQAPYLTRFFVAQLAVYFIFFAASLTFINSEKRLKTLAFLIVVFGAVMAFVGILQRLSDPAAIYGLRAPPSAVPFGPFINQHHFAAFMVMTGGVTIGLIFGKKTGNDKTLLLAIALVIMGIAVILTGSRGGLLSFIAVIAFVLLLNLTTRDRWSKSHGSSGQRGATKQKILILGSGTALIVAIFAVVLLLGGSDSILRGVGMGEHGADISDGRSHFWSVAIRIFFEHPFLGVGLDAFGTAFTRYDTWNGTLRVDRAHNEYLQMLAEAGIGGFICLAAFIYFLFKKGLGVISNAGNAFRKNVAIGSLSGCLGILIHSFFDFPLRTPSNAFFFLLLAAIATVPIETSNDSEAPRRKRRSSAP